MTQGLSCFPKEQSAKKIMQFVLLIIFICTYIAYIIITINKNCNFCILYFKKIAISRFISLYLQWMLSLLMLIMGII